MSRRAEIQLSDEEQAELLGAERIVVVASQGSRGWPHLMPLWYVVRDGECWAWTYAKSQKIRNLERESRCTLQVEAGATYDELRGVMLKAECVLHRDLGTVTGLGEEIARRYGGADLDEAARGYVAKQAAKRVGLQFRPRESATWDHRKLG